MKLIVSNDKSDKKKRHILVCEFTGDGDLNSIGKDLYNMLSVKGFDMNISRVDNNYEYKIDSESFDLTYGE